MSERTVVKVIVNNKLTKSLRVTELNKRKTFESAYSKRQINMIL